MQTAYLAISHPHRNSSIRVLCLLFFFWERFPHYLCRPSDFTEFVEDIAHIANSSSQISACSVRPGTVEDLALIVSDISSHCTHAGDI
jgi:hypothetical protein